jgi:large subunit ribosomal protein L12
MEYVYAGLLLHSAKQPIDETHVTKVLEAAGAKPDAARVKALVAALDGINIEEAISKVAMPVAAAPVAAGSEAKPKEKEKEKEEDTEKKAEEAAAGLGALFG